MKLHNIFNRHNLEIANRIIEDDVSKQAFEIDPNDQVFELKLS